MQTNEQPTSIIFPIFMLDALPATTLPIYPGLSQAPNMLACIPGGSVITAAYYYATSILTPGMIHIKQE